MNELSGAHTLPTGQVIRFVRGDITRENADAIVNAANAYLQHGAGVAGAISRQGGAIIQRESDEWIRVHGPVSHAEPAWTSGGNLGCRFVIHAVGPVWGEGDERAKLAAAVNGSLVVADRLGLKSVALPAISTGIFGFPKDLAAEIILGSIQEYFTEHPSSNLQELRVVLYDQDTLTPFSQAWQKMGWE
ncbi:MAG: macro domain-containing protein [Chloroflexota bacterium]